MSRPIVAALLSLLLAACAAPTADPLGTVTVDSAGVAIATAPAVDRALPWTFTEEFTLGGEEDGPAAFTSASARTVRTDGVDRIVVLDATNDRIEVFDGAGEHLRTVGGPGGGPGEFTFALELLDAGDGRIGLIDVSKMAVLLWAADGTLLSEERIADPSTGLGRRVLRGDTTTTMVEERDTVRTVNRLVQVVGSDTTLLARFEGAPGRFVQLSCVAVQMRPMFAPRLLWSNGWGEVAGATSSDYVVNVYRAGRLVRSIRREIAGRPSRPEDAERQYPDGWTVRFGGGGEGCTMDGSEVAEKVGVAPVLPVIDDLAFGPDGTLWVRRQGFPGDPAVVDLFDRRGAYLGTVNGRGLPMGWLGPDRVLLPVEDTETGVTRIGVYRISRDGAEGVESQ